MPTFTGTVHNDQYSRTRSSMLFCECWNNLDPSVGGVVLFLYSNLAQQISIKSIGTKVDLVLLRLAPFARVVVIHVWERVQLDAPGCQFPFLLANQIVNSPQVIMRRFYSAIVIHAQIFLPLSDVHQEDANTQPSFLGE